MTPLRQRMLEDMRVRMRCRRSVERDAEAVASLCRVLYATRVLVPYLIARRGKPGAATVNHMDSAGFYMVGPSDCGQHGLERRADGKIALTAHAVVPCRERVAELIARFGEIEDAGRVLVPDLSAHGGRARRRA